jgi:hypothetical protein
MNRVKAERFVTTPERAWRSPGARESNDRAPERAGVSPGAREFT